MRPEASVSGTRCTRCTPDSIFQLGEGAAAADFGDDFLVAAHRAFARGHDLDLPTLLGSVTLVHAEQIAGKQRCLIAAGAGADLENDVAVVHRILGDQCDSQFLFERGAARLKLRPLLSGNRAHFRVSRRILDQAIDAFELTSCRAI